MNNNVKVFAYYALHYGYEWLGWSMRSIIDFVDQIYVFYTPTPSYGHATRLSNPDTSHLAGMKATASCFGAKWLTVNNLTGEGQHRDVAVKWLADDGADLILVVDADEIWAPDHLNHAILQASRVPTEVYRVYMRHFWRSVHWVCDDPAAPVRIVNPKYKDGREGYIDGPDKVNHMGYAQTAELIQYKMDIHGHKGELRPGWFEDKFMKWTPGCGMKDVHPTNVDFWTPQLYEDVNGDWHDLVGDHPYWNLEMIR